MRVEYKAIETGKASETVEELNSLARDGWMLVCGAGKNNRVLLLERKLKSTYEDG